MAQKRVTMRDIAKECGVSPAAVSLALNHSRKENISEPLRLKIIQTATRMHYRPGTPRGGEPQTAGIFIYLPFGSHATPGKLALYNDLAAQLALKLHSAGFYSTTLYISGLEPLYNSDTLRKLDAWFFIDMDSAAFAARPDGFLGPLILLESEAEDILFCKIQTDYEAVFEKAAAALPYAPGFILLEDILNQPLLQKVIAPFAPAQVFINKPGKNLRAFLERQTAKTGIVFGDILALQAQGLFPAQHLAVVSGLTGASLFTPGTPVLRVLNSDKAAAAVKTLQSMLAYDYIGGQDNHILIAPSAV